jgi:hypothetical protein
MSSFTRMTNWWSCDYPDCAFKWQARSARPSRQCPKCCLAETARTNLDLSGLLMGPSVEDPFPRSLFFRTGTQPGCEGEGIAKSRHVGPNRFQ